MSDKSVQSRITWPCILFLAAVLSYEWYERVRYLTEIIAWGGFSPIAWVYKTTDLHLFGRDFPSGMELFATSAFMHLYLFAYRLLGISPESLIPFVVAFEYAILAGAIWLLTRTLTGDRSPILPVLVVLLLIMSNVRNLDLSRWGAYFGGQFYNIAEALVIFAIVLALKNRLVASAALLAAAFMCHPIIGLLGVAFVFGMLVSTPGDINQKQALIGFCLYGTLALGWVLLGVGIQKITGQVPTKNWFDLTRLCSFHWYPVDYGLFIDKHQERFVQFLSFLILFLHYISSRNSWANTETRALAGMGAMLLLTVLGVLFSLQSFSPFLVKAALHRADKFIIVVGLVYVVQGLWGDMRSQHIWKAFFGAATILSPFLLNPGLPLLLAVVLSSPTWWSVLKKRRAPGLPCAVTLLVIGSVLLLLTYAATGLAGSWKSSAYTGFGDPRLYLYAGAWTATLFLARRFRLEHTLPIILLVILTPPTMTWIRRHDPGRQFLDRANAYKQAQLWARDHTPVDSLFMTDPTIYYGWRDYSQRSSFGNLREWLHTSWLYTSSLSNYEEGMRRFQEFSIELGGHLTTQHPLDGFTTLEQAVRKKYYSSDAEWFLELAREHEVNYFIFDRQYVRRELPFPIAYANGDFIVTQADTDYVPRDFERRALQLDLQDVQLPAPVTDALKPDGSVSLGGIRGQFSIEKAAAGVIKFKAIKPDESGLLVLQLAFRYDRPQEIPGQNAFGLSIMTNYFDRGQCQAFIQQKTKDGWRRNSVTVVCGKRIQTDVVVYTYTDVDETQFGLSWKPAAAGETLDLVNVTLRGDGNE